MIWYIIRHADKEEGEYFNPVLRHQDPPISAKGYAASLKLRPYLADKSVAGILVSEYLRTSQTIEDTAGKLGLSPIVDSRLNEIDNGDLEGLSDGEIQRKYPEVWKAYTVRNRDFTFPEGESGEQAQARILSFMDEHRKLDENLILVSHDGWIRLLTCTILGLPVYRRWDFWVDTCGITEIEYQPGAGRWRLIRFNQVCR